ncbi:MAG: DUF2628 domain-containing protein [Alphaproteobacteria bacterium]|nr:DUF2628 domain-containing protein [Alphaproteobacteria bacterium]
MRVYSVHQSPDPLADEQIVLVKEGFCWPALLLPLIWPLVRGLWPVALGVVLVNVVLVVLALPELITTAIGIAALVLYAAEANDLRRWMLRWRGWREVGVVTGRQRDEAERRFFSVYRLSPTGVLLPRSEATA